jgi:hypothetical protein
MGGQITITTTNSSANIPYNMHTGVHIDLITFMKHNRIVPTSCSQSVDEIGRETLYLAW